MPRLVHIAIADRIRAQAVPGLIGAKVLAKRHGVSRATAQRVLTGRWKGGERRVQPPRPRQRELDVHVHLVGGGHRGSFGLPSWL